MALASAAQLSPGRAFAQDPCPSASGADAEAGWVAYQGGDMSLARRHFEAALARCDNDQYARTGLGYVALRAGDTASASSLMGIVVRAEPNNVDALVGLGLASWRTGDLDAVRTHFERVLQLAPDHPTAIEYMRRIEGAAAVDAGPLTPADQAWVDGNTELARRLYTDRLDDDPTDGLALLRVGLIHAWEGRYAASLELLDLLVDLEPSNIDGRLARARVYAWSGDTPRGQAEVRQVLEIQPDNVDALTALALFQAWSGDVDDALAGYERALSIAPEHGEGRRQHAQALAWNSDQAASLAAFRRLVEADPEDVDARLGYASALAFAGHYGASVEQYDLVLDIAPGDLRALTGKSKTLGWAGRLVDSERAALAAVEEDRASGAAWASLGQSYRWQGRDAEALSAFQAAERFAPTDPSIRDQLRSIRRSMAPLARASFTAAWDSDENTMRTTSFTAGLHASPRLEVRASAYHRGLEQRFASALLSRTAFGGMVDADLQLRPGWQVSAGVGGNVSDAPGVPSYAAVRAGIRSPERHPVVVAVNLSSSGLDETAALAERGVRSTDLLVTTRWQPGARWRVDAALGQGAYEGSESNGRRSAHLGASRLVGRFYSLGAAVRGFSFEKNLSDGYFDPDFYGIAELTGYWQYRPLPWSFLVEFAPGLQKVRSDGPTSASLRGNSRVGYRLATGREVGLSWGYSTAGLNSSATGLDGYSYSALSLSVNWVF